MELAQQMAQKMNLSNHLSQESLDKLLSPETAQKAAQLTDYSSVQNLLKELNLPELPGERIIIDDGPGLIPENPAWIPCFGEQPLHLPLTEEIDKPLLKAAIRDHQSYRFSPKAPGSKSTRNTVYEGAALGAAVGAAFAGAAGKMGALAAGVGVGSAIGAAIVVGAAAGALGAYMYDDED